jgi:signal peptidase II
MKTGKNHLLWNERYIVHFILLLTWLSDYLTKSWASGLERVIKFGPLTFELYYNPGIFLGTFSDNSPLLRVVSISTMGALLFCIYLFVQFLLPMKSFLLSLGLSMLAGGILGNITDRVLYGRVVDFISIAGGPIFNLGDVMQALGYLTLFYGVIKDWDLLWVENNLRKSNWVNPSFQMKYCFLFSGIGIGICFIYLVLSYSFFQVLRQLVPGLDGNVASEYIKAFVFIFGILTLCLAVLLIVIGKLISHRLVGPLYAFEKYILKLLKGESGPFKLRAKDEFKQLELIANLIQKKLASEEESLRSKDSEKGQC